MADEPELQPVAEDQTAEVVQEEDQGEDINLNELMNIAEEDGEGDEEGDEPDQPTPETTGQRKRLRDLVAEDQDYAREFAEEQQRLRAETAAAAQAAERQRIEAETYNRQVAEFEAARRAQLEYRAGEEAYLYALGRNDPLSAQDERERRDARRVSEDEAWAAWIGHREAQAKQAQAFISVRAGEQQAAMDALGWATRTRLPQEIISTLATKQYPTELGPGMAQYLADAFEAAVEHGKKIGRAETSKEREVVRRQVAAEAGLAAPVPDMGSTPRQTTSSATPTMSQIEEWSYEKRMEALAKDPQLYEHAVRAEQRAAARRR